MAPILTRVGQAFGFGASSGGGSSTPGKIDATGGFLSDYTHPDGTVYRSHIFSGSEDFVLTNIEGPSTAFEYLIVGGGGGGGAGGGSGSGGSAAVRIGSVPVPSVTIGTWSVTIGNGGTGGHGGRHYPITQNHNGTPSSVDFPTGAVTAAGGGAGGGGAPGPVDTYVGKPGGSGGSGGWGPEDYEAGTGSGDTGWPGSADAPSPTNGWGNDGGESGGSSAGGAGGAGQVGATHVSWSGGGAGGDGVTSTYFTGPTGVVTVAGGAGGSGSGSGGSGGAGGARSGGGPGTSGPTEFPQGNTGKDANQRTGSGGAGKGPPNSSNGGYGGDGVVIIRYKLSAIGGTTSCTGGYVSFIPAADHPKGTAMTVHTFLSSGSFVAPTAIPSANMLVLGGGGGGGPANHGGGGGAGGLKYFEGLPLPATTYPLVVGLGANEDFVGKDSIWYPGNPTDVLCGGGQKAASPNPSSASAGGQNPTSPTQTTTNALPHPGGVDVVTPTFPGSGYGGAGGNAPGAYSGGGGGVGEAGQAPPGSEAGRGGNGARYSITGDIKYYGGGGGGGGHTGSPSPQAAGGLGGGGMGGIFHNAPSPISPTGEMGDIGRNGWNGFGGGAGGCGKFGVLGTNNNGTVASGGPPTAPSLIPAIQGGRAGTIARAARGGDGIIIVSYPT